MLPNGGGSGQAFEALTLENMKKFNEETPDMEGVQYFSWGAWYEPGLIDTWRCDRLYLSKVLILIGSQ
jgi:triacylglycerol lipase